MKKRSLEKTKVCSLCGLEKKSSEFYSSKLLKDKLRSACITCEKARVNNYNNRKFKLKGLAGNIGRTKTDLSFLLHLRKAGVNCWDLDNAKTLLAAIRENSTEIKPKSIKEIVTEHKEIKKSPSGCISFINELKRAAENKMTLESYLLAGRPYRYGKKVIGIAKNHEKLA